VGADSLLEHGEESPIPRRVGEVRIALIGVGGYGATHLMEIDRLAEQGLVRFAAAADAQGPSAPSARALERRGAVFYHDYRAMLQEQSPEIVVVAAPPHLHFTIASDVLVSGAHLYLEKPPLVCVRDFEELSATLNGSGLLCQVGFQSMGSGALRQLRQLVACSPIPVRVGATGHWRRSTAYWSRSPWAGRESLGGVMVGDGALTNVFAHALMTCVSALGIEDQAPRGPITCARYHANVIEVDDTACLQVVFGRGHIMTIAVTLCAERPQDPVCSVESGPRELRWCYTGDEVESFQHGTPGSKDKHGRTSLLEELVLGIRNDNWKLSCPLERTRMFVSLAEVLSRLPVLPAPKDVVYTTGEGDETFRLIRDVDSLVDRSVREGRTFNELDPRWATASS
jgi:predicted dehydrogenase